MKGRMQTMTRSIAFTTVLFLGLAVCGTETVRAQPQTVVEEPMDKDLLATTDFKLTPVDGDLANLVGLSCGILLNDKFLIGVAAYGKTSQAEANPMGYGGFKVEYFLARRGVTQVSFGGLLGGGSAYHGGVDFFVAEPEARLSLQITPRLQLRLGGSFRFIGGAKWVNGHLDGPGVSFGLGVNLF